MLELITVAGDDREVGDPNGRIADPLEVRMQGVIVGQGLWGKPVHKMRVLEKKAEAKALAFKGRSTLLSVKLLGNIC